jgi:OFA family oxalate/formate antiporter-like MFS transporter
MSRRFLVAIAAFSVLLAPGAVYAFTLLSQPLAAGFGWRPAQVSWAFALFSLFIAVGGACGGRICDRFGPRTTAFAGAALLSIGYGLCGTLAWTPQFPALLLLYFYYGVLAGTGSGMAYIAALTAIMRWSKTRRGLAGGFVIMGFGLGTFFYGLIVRGWSGFASIQDSTKLYMDAYNTAVATNRDFNVTHVMLPADDLGRLMMVFAVSGVVFLVVTMVAATFISFPDAEADSAMPGDFTPSELFADARFYVLWAILFLNVFGGSMVIGSAAPIMNELTGLSVATAAFIYSLLAVANGLGRIALGALSDRVGRRATFITVFALQALSFMLLGSIHNPVGVTIAIGMLLFAYGGGFATVPASFADIFGTRHFGANYGAAMSAWGIAAVLGAYFVNVLRGAGGNYIGMMQPLSILILVAVFFPMIIDAGRAQRNANPRRA